MPAKKELDALRNEYQRLQKRDRRRYTVATIQREAGLPYNTAKAVLKGEKGVRDGSFDKVRRWLDREIATLARADAADAVGVGPPGDAAQGFLTGMPEWRSAGKKDKPQDGLAAAFAYEVRSQIDRVHFIVDDEHPGFWAAQVSRRVVLRPRGAALRSIRFGWRSCFARPEVLPDLGRQRVVATGWLGPTEVAEPGGGRPLLATLRAAGRGLVDFSIGLDPTPGPGDEMTVELSLIVPAAVPGLTETLRDAAPAGGFVGRYVSVPAVVQVPTWLHETYVTFDARCGTPRIDVVRNLTIDDPSVHYGALPDAGGLQDLGGGMEPAGRMIERLWPPLGVVHHLRWVPPA